MYTAEGDSGTESSFASCDEGDLVQGGGFVLIKDADVDIELLTSLPSNDDAWSASVETGDILDEASMQAFARCLDITP